MKMKSLARVLGAAAVFVSASASQAYNLPFPAGQFLLSDNSAEYLINCTPQAQGCGSTASNDTTVDLGDRLHGIFLIDDISGTGILAGSGYSQLAGVFDVTVTSVVAGVDIFNNPQYAYQFGVTASFATDYGVAAGSGVKWFTDDNHNFARETNSGQTTQQLEALITSTGTHFWSSGFTGSAFWNALTGTNDIAQIGIGNVGGGQFKFGLNLTENLSGMAFIPVPCVNQALGNAVVLVDQCANGGILTPAPQTGFTTPYDVWDDVNFTMNQVPEPATLSLLGLSLLGFAATARRGKKRA